MSDGNGETGSTVANYLAERPRLVGGLFTLVLLLSQAGMVVADGSCSTTCGT